MREIDETTQPHSGAVDGLSATASLVVVERDGVRVLGLPAGTRVLLGRCEPADLVIAHPTLSRRHCWFERAGDEVWVEDLGSTNGTWLNGRRVERRARMVLGDEVRVGEARIVLQAMNPWEAEMHGLPDHASFCRDVAQALGRASPDRGSALVFVQARGPRAADPDQWCPAIRSRLPMGTCFGRYAADTIEILAAAAQPRHAERLATSLTTQWCPPGLELRVGAALYPGAGTTVDELVAAARAALLQTSATRRFVVAEVAEVAEGPAGGGGPVIRAPAMVQVYDLVERVATSNLAVLICGETGTGKELVARALHERSPRRDRPLRALNCGALPDTLIESTLFGHERGSFTGAERRATGVFEEAEGGTVFLDEVGELSASAQAALLRVLETRTICRVGSSKEVPVDVRIVAATHRELAEMVDQGTFRRDLLYRLEGVRLSIPPLRERPGEIEPLVHHFLERANRENGRAVRGVDPEALRALTRYGWPGNVRELRNVVERGVVVALGEVLELRDLPGHLLPGPTRAPAPPPRTTFPSPAPGAASGGGPRERADDDDLDEGATAEVSLGGLLREVLQRCEAQLIRDALDRTGHNQSEAARDLDMPRRTLVYKIRAYDLGPHEPRDRVEGDRGVLAAHTRPGEEKLDLRSRLEAVERRLVAFAQQQADHDPAATARLLGIHPKTLAVKLSKYEL